MAKNLDQLRRGDEFITHARSKGAQVRNGKGSHFVVSTARGSCVVPAHSKDLGKGLRCKIVKLFIAIGLASMAIMAYAGLG
jgi:predicted RNA binding protein YcfA (HicA-like mRNA interferase family)